MRCWTVLILLGMIASNGCRAAVSECPAVFPDSTFRSLALKQVFDSYFNLVPLQTIEAFPFRYGLSAKSGFTADSIRLYQAIDSLQCNKPLATINLLKQNAESLNGIWYTNTEWYYALALLRLNKSEEAAQILYELSEREIHPYQIIAHNLLADIRRITQK